MSRQKLVTFEYDQFYDFKVDFYLIERSQHRKHIQELLFNEELWESTVPDLQFVGFRGLLRRPRHLMGKPTTTSWLTKCSQIRSFVAALDSRVQMAKIEEAIKQLGLQSDVHKEEAVGGDVISITDFSKPINFEDAYFQDHIQNVSLRMHRHGIFHMEICIKDHPVETKELKKSEVFRFFAAIHHATIPPNTSYHENLKRHLYDQLTTYGKLYKATRELAAVYELEMKNKINIVFYNYYKLIITYSKDRNLALIASWKINYDQLIANFIQVSTTKDGKVVIADRWNPHVLVSSLLMERLKESDSLPELVNYLVNTERSLSCLYYFSQVHLNSKRATEQIIGIASGPTSINIKNILIPVTEYQIRLVHGSAHIDFYLLNNNKVGIKATQIKSDDEYLKEKGPKLQKLPGFSHFWGQFCMETKLETIVSREVQDYPRDPGNPSSVPPQETEDAALDSHPMSCPPKYDERFEEFVKYAEKQERDDLHKVFIIEPDVFEKAMGVPEDKEKPSLSKRNVKTEPMMPPQVSPFEGYLRAVNYIARLPQTLEAFARSQNPLQALPITDLKHDEWSVTFDLQGVHASTVAYPAWTVKFRVFLCPTKFTVSIKMEFSGPSQANDTDIKVFVKYFESVVVPMDNEYALHAFFCMCRINVSGVFSAFARLMAAQMDPSSQLNYYWIVHLQLVNIRKKGPNESSLPDFVSGIVINKSDVLITIGLRPSKKREKDPFKVIKIAFVYNFDTENIRYQPTGPNDENRPKVEAALHNMAMEPSEPCIIWPSIRRLIERNDLQLD
uniref:NARG2_C domain-containing protein n=1 Tax=Bursaphelenchus xylophilus TaxID=6326 RepID=A0A1I7RJG7_BURXY